MFFDVSDKLNLIKCNIEWKIYDLILRKEFFMNDQIMTSKKFFNPICPSVAWELRINTKNSYNQTMISLMQVGLNESKVSVFAKYKIYAYDIEGNRNFENKTESDKAEIQLYKISHADGSVLLYCEVEFVPQNIKCEYNYDQIANSQVEERNLIRELFMDRTLTDFVIKIGDVKINVHRCILAQNSSVFLTMFEQTDMIEAKNGELEITDSSPECFQALIEYFYLGQISSNILENNVDDLYAIAHKYEVHSLMDKCEIIMASSIDKTNFARRCSYSQLYNLITIEKACIKYIVASRKNFLDSNEWKEFKTKNKDFANHLMELALKTG
uniref:BTB domain-containing protein n=1 Tax=Meloidogyne javanica TaxID=6303 RepID=A0A915LNZ5_MELJA